MNFIIILTFFLYFLPLCIAAYPLISSNLVIAGVIQSPTYSIGLTDPGDQNLSLTIPFPSTFKQPPLVLISIIKTDMQIKQQSIENISTAITSTSIGSFTLSVSKLGPIRLYEIFYYYIAIEPSQDTFVVHDTLDFQANLDPVLSSSTPGLKVAKKFLPYQRSLSSSISEQRKVSVYFTGYLKSVDTTVNTQSTTNIYVYIELKQNGFYIIIESRDPKDDVSTMQTVSYNYIEFYEPTSGYLQMNQIKDTAYLNNVPANAIDISGNTYLPFSTTIDIDSNGASAIFIGVSGAGYDVGGSITVGRIALLSPTFTYNSPQATSTFTFTYQSWSGTVLTSAASEVLAFVRQDCSSQSHVFFDAGKQCLQACPNRFYPVEELPGKFFCQPCDSSCLTCSGPSATECLTCEKFKFNNLCYETQPNATGCDTQPVETSSKECVNCAAKNCSKCSYANTNECLVCESGFVLKGSTMTTCFCENVSQFYSDSEKKCIDKDDPFSEEAKKRVKDVLESAETTTFALSIFFTITSVFTQQGSVLMSSAFTNQKIFYVLLLNAELPSYLLEFTRSLTNHGVLKKFSYLNWIKSESKQDEFNVGNKFDSESITSNILVNSGGGLILLSFATGFYIIFFILTSITSLKPRVLNIYTRYIGGFLTESLEITILVLQFSIAIALTQITSLNKEDLTVQLLIIIFCQLFVVAFLVFSFRYLKNQPIQIKQRDSAITHELTTTYTIVDKLNNGCMQEKISSKIYMLIFVFLEGILFPIFVVTARFSFNIQIFGILLFQTIELVTTSVIQPFYSHRENKVYIFVQVNILLIYCTIAVVEIGLMHSNNDPTSKDYPLYMNYFALSYLALAIIAMITPAIIQIYVLYITLKEYYLKNKNNNPEKSDGDLEKLGTELITFSKLHQNKDQKQSLKSDFEKSSKQGLQFFKYKYHSYQQQLKQLYHS